MIDGVLYVLEEGELVGRESGDEEEVGVLWIGRQQRRTGSSNSRAVSSTTAAASSSAATTADTLFASSSSSSATTTAHTLLDERADQRWWPVKMTSWSLMYSLRRTHNGGRS